MIPIHLTTLSEWTVKTPLQAEESFIYQIYDRCSEVERFIRFGTVHGLSGCTSYRRIEESLWKSLAIGD